MGTKYKNTVFAGAKVVINSFASTFIKWANQDDNENPKKGSSKFLELNWEVTLVVPVSK